jgi:hypothetical protein
MPIKTANEIMRRVEALNVAKISNSSIDNDTARWLDSVGEELVKKLQAVELIEGRASGTLDDFVGDYIKSRTDAKRSTILGMERTRVYLTGSFRPGTPLNSITPGDCDRFHIWLKAKYAEATVSRSMKRARQFFIAPSESV